MFKLQKEQTSEPTWKVGDTLLSDGEHIFMIVEHSNGFGLCDLHLGECIGAYSTLSGLIDNMIDITDIKGDIICKFQKTDE